VKKELMEVDKIKKKKCRKDEATYSSLLHTSCHAMSHTMRLESEVATQPRCKVSESIWSDEPMDYDIEMTPESESAVKSEGN